jgi:hypothetical protein
MKFNGKGTLLLLLTIVSILSFGCGRNLTRERAFDLVNKNLPKYIIGYIMYGQRLIVFEEDIAWLNKLNNDGLIRAFFIEKSWGVPTYNIAVTEKGNKYCIGEIKGDERIMLGDVNRKKIILAERKLIKITGIKQNPEKKEAMVEFTWKMENINEFGEAVKGKVYFKNGSLIQVSEKIPSNDKISDGIAYLALYDDGWRVIKFKIGDIEYTRK